MKHCRVALALLLALLVLSLGCMSTGTAAVPVQAKLSGEAPSFSASEKWVYNFNFTNQSSGSTVTATINVSTSGFYTKVTDYHGNTRDCYVFTFTPLDPQTLIIAIGYLSDTFNIGNVSVNSLLSQYANESSVKLYLDASNFSWVGANYHLKFDNGTHVVDVTFLALLNETYPYLMFNFPLLVGETFGNYTPSINVSLDGDISYTNSSGTYHYSIDENVTFTYPNSYSFYPLFKVVSTETVTVEAGSFECWKIGVLNASNPNQIIGYVWYSPDVKNYIKGELATGDSSGNTYNIQIELVSYEGYTPPIPPGAWLMLFMYPYIVLYNYFQGQQRNNLLFIAGIGAVAGVAIAAVAIASRRKSKP